MSDKLDYSSLGPPASRLSDELAYVLPMAAFLVLTSIGGQWAATFVWMYAARSVLVAGMLFVLWRHYTKILWSHLWLGAAMGVVGVVQWVGMELLLRDVQARHPLLHLLHRDGTIFNPFEEIHSSIGRWLFIGIRLAGATLVVPVMEELFWRDFLWRTLLAPNDFKLAEVGERAIWPWVVVSLVFSMVHVQWMTAIVWGLMVGGLLMATRSLGAAILMHAVTNLLLGVYVLKTGDWYFW